jgi:hypothetical protein
MENSKGEATEREALLGAGKKPYTTPKLKKHGDVDEITEVLRLAGAIGNIGTEFDA